MKQLFRQERGFAHHFLLLAIIIVIGVASFGTYKLVFSGAESFSSNGLVSVNTSNGCWLAGRVWKNNACSNQCRPNADQLKGKHCENALAPTIGKARCINELHRVYVDGVGCSRRVDQDNTANAPQCVKSYPYYVADKAVDYCKTVAAAKPATPATTPAKPATTTTTPAKPATPPKSTGASTVVTYEAVSKVVCERNGRSYDASKGCVTTCNSGAGNYKVGKDKVGYCSSAFGPTTTLPKAKCEQLNRVWSDAVPGCARLYTNVDQANNSLQCQKGFNYYHKNVKGSDDIDGYFAYCTKTEQGDKATMKAAGVGVGVGSAAASASANNGGTSGNAAGANSSGQSKPKKAEGNKPNTDKRCEKGYHRNKQDKCVKNGVVRQVRETVSNAVGTVSCTVTRSCPKAPAPAPKPKGVSAAFCKGLGRSYNGNGGCGGCTQSGYERNPNKTRNGYDICTKKQSTGGTQLNTAKTDKESKTGSSGLPQKTVSCSEFVGRYNGPGYCPRYRTGSDGTLYCKREGATAYGVASTTRYVTTSSYLIKSKTC